MSWIHGIVAGNAKPDIRTKWGYSFEWTPLHQTPEEHIGLRKRWDKLADEALARISVLKGERDLYTTLKEEHDNDDVLGKLWSEVNTIPEWVDWEQIQRGQDVFYRYATAIIQGLTYSSLLGGMGAYRIAEVLARTGGFSKSVARRRMFETMQHILQCTKSLESIKPGGDGQISSIKVRLLHAAVRGRILKLREAHLEYYDLEKLGMPINDLDSIATICSFSASMVWMSLPKQGLSMRHQEVLDYLALWRLIAHYVGCPTDIFESPELAKSYMDCIFYYEVNPSETSKVLSQNVISSLVGTPPQYPSTEYLVAIARRLNGDELCDELGLPQASLTSKMLVYAQCIFVIYLCYSSRFLPGVDKYKISALKRAMWNTITNEKIGLAGTTNFGFQFVPQLTTKTEAGNISMEKTWREMKGGAETRCIIVLAICMVILIGLGWIGQWVFVRLVELISQVILNPTNHNLTRESLSI